ncbi:MAG: glycosyltransferase [Krumholzibacteria bacterium]|nr:glycosyltransferase [Candidatus Krumholzibacteria bacterium]
MAGDAIWICWERQRRNRELAAALGIPLHEFGEVGRVRNRALKYLRGLAATTGLLLRRRPRRVVAMNPSIVLAVFCVTLGRLLPVRVIIDAHNSGLVPMGGRSRLLNALANYAMRHASLTIVTNEGLRPLVEANRGRVVILPDRLPTLATGRIPQLRGTHNLVFVCTYADDEPYREVLEAARLLPADWVVYVTGNPERARFDGAAVPPNVELTGFVAEEDFVGLLAAADAVVDLTTREHCLVCGAYEAVALGKVAVLSDTDALRDWFGEAAILTGHAPDELAASMRRAVDERAVREAGMPDVRQRIEARWQEYFTRLCTELGREGP